MELRNPTMLASGFLGISQAIFNRLYNADVGAIVSKSISSEPREGYRNPTAVCLEGGSYQHKCPANNQFGWFISSRFSTNNK